MLPYIHGFSYKWCFYNLCFLHFFANHHFCAFIHHDNLMQLRVLDGKKLPLRFLPLMVIVSALNDNCFFS